MKDDIDESNKKLAKIIEQEHGEKYYQETLNIFQKYEAFSIPPQDLKCAHCKDKLGNIHKAYYIRAGFFHPSTFNSLCDDRLCTDCVMSLIMNQMYQG